MSAYKAPVDEMMFVLREIADLQGVSQLPGYGDASADLVAAILDEAGKFASGVLAPLNAVGDREGCVQDAGQVRTATGFKDAYDQFCEMGWNGLAAPEDWGGQDLPWLVSSAVSEIWNAANLSFALCPMLTQGAVELLLDEGQDDLKQTFLPKMVSGQWTGTMNLTEPQAGSDLGAVNTRAVPDGNAYRLTGQKIFISYGDHDLAENIIHMVLARTPDAPDGVKGISLFVVPKILVGEDGELSAANDVTCVSLEHKLGIHASPTCVLSFGDRDGAVGYLVGEENQGLKYMFNMMNNARLGVGVEGVALSERATQMAVAYARERVQGRDMASKDPAPVSINHHPDVKRMTLSMKALTEATRAVTYYAAACLDKAKRHTDPAVKRYNQALVDVLIPVVKAWSTDSAVEVTNIAVQVHGGMGYMEETGAAQLLRDARITPIYEGTNGIQALDLVGRKVARDKGLTVNSMISQMRGMDKELSGRDDEALAAIRLQLAGGIDSLEVATSWLLRTYADNPPAVAAGAVHYLRLLGIVTGGWLLARGALAADDNRGLGGDDAFLTAKIATARFFADQILIQADMLASAFMRAPDAVAGVEETGL